MTEVTEKKSSGGSPIIKWGLILITFGLLGFLAYTYNSVEGYSGDPGAVSHSADGFYWVLPFTAATALELPRLFLVSEDDGGMRFDAFATTKSVLKSGNYELMDASGDHALSDARVDEYLQDPHHPYLYYEVKPKKRIHRRRFFDYAPDSLRLFCSCIVAVSGDAIGRAV